MEIRVILLLDGVTDKKVNFYKVFKSSLSSTKYIHIFSKYNYLPYPPTPPKYIHLGIHFFSQQQQPLSINSNNLCLDLFACLLPNTWMHFWPDTLPLFIRPLPPCSPLLRPMLSPPLSPLALPSTASPLLLLFSP